MTKALIVRSDGTKEIREADFNNLDTLSEVVGGWIEFVYVDDGVHLYCNEEGKIHGLPINPEATRISGIRGDFLCGDVIFLGETDEGAEADVPEEWLGRHA